MKAEKLPKQEQLILKVITILMIVVLVYLLFIAQRILAAMIVGVAFLGAQRAYLHLRTKKR